MTAHRHADLIKAKVDNMELVVFCYSSCKGEFKELPKNYLPDTSGSKYFMCLPKHKEACLHWLNGGDCLISFDSVKDVCGVIHGCDEKKWKISGGFMNQSATIRIKPRKEKRWIAHFMVGNDYCTTQFSYKTIHQLKGAAHAPNGFDDWQFIEIEVEV